MTFEEKQLYILRELNNMGAYYFKPFVGDDFKKRIEILGVIELGDFLLCTDYLIKKELIEIHEPNDKVPMKFTFITDKGIEWLERKEKDKRLNYTTLAVIFGGVAGGFYYSLEILLKILKMLFYFFCR